MPTSSPSYAFADVIDDIVERVRATVNTGKVKVVAVPNDSLHEYTAETGILIRVRAPEPQTLSGAGRYGFIVQRTVDFVILTESLKDPPGVDLIAVKAHVTREEAVINAMTHQFGNRIGIQVHWVPGGDDVARQVKTDNAMLKSGLSYRVLYMPPMTVRS